MLFRFIYFIANTKTKLSIAHSLKKTY